MLISIIRELISGNSDTAIYMLLGFLISLPALLFSLTAHEYAHGYAAYKNGDGFAKASGRLSLNPFRHLDPLGTMCMLLFGFGWAKPVPIVPSNFKHGKVSMLIVSLAGIFTNIVLAFVGMVFLYLFRYIVFPGELTQAAYIAASILLYFFQYIVVINITLALFNLVPIPPLDGYKVIRELFINYRNQFFFAKIERYSFLFTLGLLLLLRFNGDLLSIPVDAVYNLFDTVCRFIFQAFI